MFIAEITRSGGSAGIDLDDCHVPIGDELPNIRLIENFGRYDCDGCAKVTDDTEGLGTTAATSGYVPTTSRANQTVQGPTFTTTWVSVRPSATSDS